MKFEIISKYHLGNDDLNKHTNFYQNRSTRKYLKFGGTEISYEEEGEESLLRPVLAIFDKSYKPF